MDFNRRASRRECSVVSGFELRGWHVVEVAHRETKEGWDMAPELTGACPFGWAKLPKLFASWVTPGAATWSE